MSAIWLEVFAAAAAAASFTIGETLSVISGGCEAPVLAVQALDTCNLGFRLHSCLFTFN